MGSDAETAPRANIYIGATLEQMKGRVHIERSRISVGGAGRSTVVAQRHEASAWHFLHALRIHGRGGGVA
jgi:hypothetical protein